MSEHEIVAREGKGRGREAIMNEPEVKVSSLLVRLLKHTIRPCFLLIPFSETSPPPHPPHLPTNPPITISYSARHSPGVSCFDNGATYNHHIHLKPNKTPHQLHHQPTTAAMAPKNPPSKENIFLFIPNLIGTPPPFFPPKRAN